MTSLETGPVILPFRGASTELTRCGERLHGLDYLRAGAALAVVLLHATMPYMHHPLPIMKWAVTESVRSESADYVGWGINSFIMPLFFLMSGFLTSQASERRSATQLVLTRGKRLGSAFAVGCLFVLPLDLYAWLLGWVVQGEIPFGKLRSLKIEGDLRAHLGGFSHLWYLQCLAALTLVAGVARQLSPWRLRQIPLSWVLLFNAIASVLALRVEPEILLGFKNLWFPSPMKLLFYAGFFATGWRFAKSDETWRRGAWPLTLSLAALSLFLCVLPEIQIHVQATSDGSRLTMLAISYVVIGGAAALGIFSRCVGGFGKTPPVAVRYVANASLWIYLLHHPVVALTQVDLLPVALPAEIKMAISFVAGVSFPLLTYRVLVQGKALGRILDGDAKKSPPIAVSKLAMRRAA